MRGAGRGQRAGTGVGERRGRSPDEREPLSPTSAHAGAEPSDTNGDGNRSDGRFMAMGWRRGD